MGANFPHKIVSNLIYLLIRQESCGHVASCKYLHAVWLLHLIIQLHHRPVLSDHTWGGGLPSAGHDDDNRPRGSSGWIALTWCLWLASGNIKEAELPRMQDYCHKVTGGSTVWGTEEQPGGLAGIRNQIQDCVCSYIWKEGEHRTVSQMGGSCWDSEEQPSPGVWLLAGWRGGQ